MRRLLALLVLLLLARPACAAIARTGSGAGTTSFTFSATATNDLKVIFAYRSGSTTAPSLPAGWTTISTGSTATGGTTGSFRIGCNVSSSSSDTGSGTWTNATNIAGASYSGTAVNATGNCNISGIGTTGTSNAKTSTTASYGAITLQDSNSWVIGFLGDSAASLCTPSGMTNVTSSGDADISDTNANVASWSTTTCSVSSSTWMTALVEVLNPPGTPQVVQWTASSNTKSGTRSTANTTLHLRLPNGTQSGNAIVVGFQCDNAQTPAITVTDDGSNNYTQGIDFTDTTNSQRLIIYFAPNVASNTRQIDIKFSQGINSVVSISAAAAEVTNIVRTSSAVDVSAGNQATSATITSGSITPNASGEFFFHYSAQYTGTSGSSSGHTITVGSQSNITWVLRSADTSDAQALQTGVYSSVAAINPTLTQSASSHFASVTATFKAATSGSTATGMRIQSTQHISLFSAANGGPGYPNPATVQFPASGNLLVATVTSGNSHAVSGITDNKSNTWSKCGSGGSAGPHTVNMWYAKNPTTGNDLTLTVTSDSVTGVDQTMVMNDLIGADTSSPCDTSGTGSASGVQSSAVTTLTGPSSVTASAAGIMLWGFQQEFQTVDSITAPSGGLFDSTTSSDEPFDGPTNLDQNGGFGHVATAASTSYTWTAHFTGSNPQQNWLGYAANFKAPSAGGPACNSISLLGVGCK